MSIRDRFRGLASLGALALLTASCATVPPLNAEAWGSSSYVPRVQMDNVTPLGAARLIPFATYIRNMHEHIHPIFEEEMVAGRERYPELRSSADLVVNLEIGVEPGHGNLVLLGVAKSSGSVSFDAIALRAVRRAWPFGAPPPVIVSPDGRVYLHWEFHSDPYDACATRNVRPFMLKETALPTVVGGTGARPSALSTGDGQPPRLPPGTTPLNCRFPPEADTAKIDEGWAMLMVKVGADGRTLSVSVVQDSGHGFGEAARTCVLGKRYLPALDSSSMPTVAYTAVKVRFKR